MSGWASAISSIAGLFHDDRMKEDQENKEYDFARNSIQWRVDDANRAGIHPLYALGAPTMSAGPGYYGGSDHFASLGQNLDRSIQAMRSRKEREAAAINSTGGAGVPNENSTAGKLQLENMSLQNELLRSRIARENSAQVPPPMPSMGGSSGAPPGAVEFQPARPVVGDPNDPGREAGIIQDFGYARTPSGISIVRSADAANRLEDDFVGGVMWNYRNNVLPNVGRGPRPPRGYRWDHMTQSFVPASKNTGSRSRRWTREPFQGYRRW